MHFQHISSSLHHPLCQSTDSHLLSYFVSIQHSHSMPSPLILFAFTHLAKLPSLLLYPLSYFSIPMSCCADRF